MITQDTSFLKLFLVFEFCSLAFCNAQMICFLMTLHWSLLLYYTTLQPCMSHDL